MNIALQKITSNENMIRPSINMDNVEQILSESKKEISEDAIKCKKLLGTYMAAGSTSNSIENTFQKLLTNFTTSFERNLKVDNSDESDLNKNITTDSTSSMFSAIGIDRSIQVAKEYIDLKLEAMENRIISKIEEKFVELEKRQNEKLDRILHILTENGNIGDKI